MSTMPDVADNATLKFWVTRSVYSTRQHVEQLSSYASAPSLSLEHYAELCLLFQTVATYAVQVSISFPFGSMAIAWPSLL